MEQTCTKEEEMNMSIKKRIRIIGLVAFLCAITLSICPTGAFAASATQELVPYLTPPAGGGAYILGAGQISVTNKYMPGGIKFVHEATTGTMEEVKKLQRAEKEKKDMLATFGTVDGNKAYKGLNEYANNPFPGLRAIFMGQYVDEYLVVPANSPIKSFADVKGKRIAIGGPGSSVSITALLTLSYYGITPTDFKYYYYVYKETVEGIRDGSLDGGFLAGGYPMASYVELSTTHNVRIVPVDEEIGKKLVSENPGYYQSVVKAGIYKGHEKDTSIVGFTGSVWTHAAVRDDLIYNFLKTLFAHKEEYYTIHRDAKALTLETATKTIAVPLHPGAEKCLKELGAIK
jgi:TRAP transporter TAXI family solute receptor